MSGRCWLITRKYPPSVGGMETLSYELTSGLAALLPTRLIAPGRGSRWLPLFMLRALVLLAAGALRGDVRAIHLGDPVLAPLGWLGKRAGIPVAVTVHGLDVTFPSPLYQWMLRTFALGFDHYVCISRAARDAALQRGVDPERASIVPVGVRMPPASASAPPEPMRGPGLWLLYVGRLVRRKGLAWFIAEVLPRLRERFPAVRLAVVGSGPDESAVREAVARGGIAEAVVFLGAVDETTKWACVRAADVCIAPNITVPGDIEGFGIVALEAGAAGKPLVASALEGLLDAVTDGVGGRLVRPGSAESWLAALSALLEDPDERARLGAAARREVERRFAWPGICAQYASILEELAADAR